MDAISCFREGLRGAREAGRHVLLTAEDLSTLAGERWVRGYIFRGHILRFAICTMNSILSTNIAAIGGWRMLEGRCMPQWCGGGCNTALRTAAGRVLP